MDRQFVYIILAVAVFLFVAMMVKDWWFPAGKKKKPEGLPPASSPSGWTIALPLCLQAYERLVVFLERIRPEALIRRLEQPQMSVQQTRQRLIASIRSEFEHNISQQIYVSTASWEAVESAKEQMVHFINATSLEFPPEEPDYQFRKALLERSARQNDPPATLALKVLNSESKKLLESTKSS